MPSFRDVRLQLTRDPNFVSPLLRFLRSQTVYRSFSLEGMGLTADGFVLVPLYSTEQRREGTPDGYALLKRDGANWSVVSRFDNPEPRVL